MRQYQLFHSCSLCKKSCLSRSRVLCLKRPVLKLVCHRPVMDEEICPSACLFTRLTRPCVPAVNTLPSGPAFAYHFGRHYRPAVYFDRFPFLELLKKGSCRYPEFNGFFPVKSPRASFFFKDITKAWNAVVSGYGFDRILSLFKNIPIFQFMRIYLKSEPVISQFDQELHHLSRPFRPVDLKRFCPPVKRHCLDKPGYPQEMICMEMSDEYGTDLHTRFGAHHLLLRAFAAVKEHHIALPVDHYCRRVAVRRGQGASCAKKSYTQHEGLNYRVSLN